MNRISRSLGPSNRGAASLYGQFCHVRSLQYRAAVRCIHTGTNGEEGGKPEGNEVLKSTSEGRSDTQAGGLQSADHSQRTPSDSTLSISRYRLAKDSSSRAEAFQMHQKNKRRIRQMAQTGAELPRHQRLSTIVYDVPEQATKRNMLEYLDRAEMTAKEWNLWTHDGGDQAVVILFTTGLANFVESDTTLVPDVLKKITRSSEWRHKKPLEIDVVCACVDGIAPVPEMLSSSRGQRPEEGITILHGPHNTTLPSLWTEDEAPPSRSPSMQATLSLRQGDHGPPDLTLPLANTLFKNGRLSTLLVSRWQWSADTYTFIPIKGPSERANVNVKVFASRGKPKAFIPAVPLTPAREIASGLGNIVRTINFGVEDGIGPASRELEPTVTKYLEAMGYGNTTIDVWAMIIPPESVPKGARSSNPPPSENRSFSLTPSPDELQSKWLDDIDEDEVASYIRHWIRKGNAKLCRVLSGGGGWGAKQGLLSLDPQIMYSEVPEARFDFSGGSLEDQQTSALGNIAQAGAFIQFFVALREPTSYPWPTRMIKPGPYSHMRKSTVFGAVPSTVDDVVMPLPEPEGQATDGQHARKSNSIHFKAGHFGFVSERGMFLRHGPQYKPGHLSTADRLTKIDLPYSYFYVDYRRPLNEQNPTPSLPIRKTESRQ